MNFQDYYSWYKAAHIVAVISWMAAMFYMPRLFVYHTRAEKGSVMDDTFKTMERRLLKIIMNPALIATYFFGLLNAYIYGLSALGMWFHIKMVAVLILTLYHAFMANRVRAFANGKNEYSENFYRLINEIPVLFMIIAVIMVVVKPFE